MLKFFAFSVRNFLSANENNIINKINNNNEMSGAKTKVKGSNEKYQN